MSDKPNRPQEPAQKSHSEFVNEAYHLDNPEDMADFYRKWAADYDRQMLVELDYVSPTSIAAELVRHLPLKQGAVLDVGCGTGLTSRLLAEQGFQQIDGIDLSQEMLAVAGERGIYRNLFQADLNQPLPLESARYDGAVSSGTFTHGHVGPEPLEEIFRVLKPGGLLACTVHQDLWQKLGFETRFAELVERRVAEQISLELGPYFRGKPPEGWFCVYRKCAVEL